MPAGPRETNSLCLCNWSPPHNLEEKGHCISSGKGPLCGIPSRDSAGGKVWAGGADTEQGALGLVTAKGNPTLEDPQGGEEKSERSGGKNTHIYTHIKSLSDSALTKTVKPPGPVLLTIVTKLAH